MKTLLIILTLFTGQAFALNVYNHRSLFLEHELGKQQPNTNCIYINSVEQEPVFGWLPSWKRQIIKSFPETFMISTPNTQGIKHSIFPPFTGNCKAYNEYQRFYENAYKKPLPALLMSPKVSNLGFIPIDYTVQYNLKNGAKKYGTCSGSLFNLNNNESLIIITAKHCVEPFISNDSILLPNSLHQLKEGILGKQLSNIPIEQFSDLEQNPEVDAATMVIKNNYLSELATSKEVTFEKFKQQIKLNYSTINNTLFNPHGPIQLFFFGGKGFLYYYTEIPSLDAAHAVSTAYVYEESSPNVILGKGKNADGFSTFTINTTKILANEINGLAFCTGDAGGAVVKYDPTENKYIFLGIYISSNKKAKKDNVYCGSKDIKVLPAINFLDNY